MAEQTVREQLVEVLDWLLEHALDCTKQNCGRRILLDVKARAALDRARKEPEGCICGECPMCAKDTASACGCWDAGREVGYEAGTEAQRERVGGGRA